MNQQPERVEATVLERVDEQADTRVSRVNRPTAPGSDRYARLVVDGHRATGPAIVARCMMRRSW